MPLPSGETLRVQIDWEAQLPRVRRRTGYKDDFLLVAQWFPKLGVLEETWRPLPSGLIETSTPAWRRKLRL